MEFPADAFANHGKRRRPVKEQQEVSTPLAIPGGIYEGCSQLDGTLINNSRPTVSASPPVFRRPPSTDSLSVKSDTRIEKHPSWPTSVNNGLIARRNLNLRATTIPTTNSNMHQHLFILPSPFNNMAPKDGNPSATAAPNSEPDPKGPRLFQQALSRSWGRDSPQELQATSGQQRGFLFQQHNESLNNMVREAHEASRGDPAFPATVAKPQDKLNDEDEWERSFVGSSATVAPSKQGSTRMDELIRLYRQSLPTAASLTQVVTDCADDDIFGSSKK